MTAKLSYTHIDKAGSSPALKLPPLFSLTPSSSGKGTQTQRRNALARQPSQEIMPEEKALILPSTKDQGNGPIHGIHILIHWLDQLLVFLLILLIAICF
jgi:hypothetical protein